MTQNNTDILLAATKKWKTPGAKIIIGIDGYSGAGKTTLLKDVDNYDILVVNRDDFAVPRKDFGIMYKNAKTDDEKVEIMVNETIDIEELVNFLKKYKKGNTLEKWTLRGDISGLKDEVKEFDFSKEVLIVEGIFLFRHDHLSDLIDRKVFIDIDQDVADERRRKREKEKWGEEYFPDTHPDSYFKYLKIGFNNYLREQNPIEQADLVISTD